MPPETSEGAATRTWRSKWPLAGGALAGLVLRIVFSGGWGAPYTAMMASFVLLAPVLVGAVAVYLAERTQRRTWGYYFAAGAGANALFVLGTLLILIEGFICVILALPLFALLGGLAGLIAGAVCRFTVRPHRAVAGVAALPLLLGAVERHIPLPRQIDEVSSTLFVAAPPEDVWAALLDAPQIEAREIGAAWMYRIGVPLPLSAVTERRGTALVRHIAMAKNVHFDQVADDWLALRRVRWTYRFAPDSFPPGALDDHVRIGGEYFDVADTEYTLEPAPGGTRLGVRMGYRVSTHFNWYARPIAWLLVRNFEGAALQFYAGRAEPTNNGAPAP
ncbi:MAG TPA: SRPBCC domain-containing protein [Gammaproteobacteria bacterium]|nr:SRPBCC domain-containing protein [Gammaproteobacteria bacterium]